MRPYSGLTYKHDLLRTLVNFQPEHRVAEIGVGTGFSCFALAEKVDRVTGIDIDRRLVDALNEHARDYDNLRFICADVTTDTPSGELRGKMDVVFSFDTFLYTHPPERFLGYSEALLKPDGKIVICFPNQRDETLEGSVNFANREALLAAISAARLRSESIRTVRHTRWFNFITANLWYRMKKIACPGRCGRSSPVSTFSESIAYRLITGSRAVSLPMRAYAAVIMALIRLGGAYESSDSGQISGEYLIVELCKARSGPYDPPGTDGESS